MSNESPDAQKATQNRNAKRRLAIFVFLKILASVAAIVGIVYIVFLVGRETGKRAIAGSMVASADLASIKLGLEMYFEDTGRFPTQAQGLQELLLAQHRGPYVKKNQLVDPWGRAYIYTFGNGFTRPAVSTLGADGVVGGSGDNADFAYFPLRVQNMGLIQVSSCPACGAKLPNSSTASCSACGTIIRRSNDAESASKYGE